MLYDGRKQWKNSQRPPFLKWTTAQGTNQMICALDEQQTCTGFDLEKATYTVG
jgi:hypothetical protein